MSDNQEQEYLEDGYVKISRKIFKSKTFNGLNAIQKYIAIYLILMANWKDNEWWDSYQKKFIKIKRGSFITSIEQIRKDIKDRLVTTKKIRTCVELLKNMQFLAIETTSHHSHVTIIKYDLYQTDKNYKANKRAKQGQSKGKARAITNKDKKDKKDKNKEKEKGIIFLKAWKEYKTMRTKIRKPLTEHAEELIINELNKLATDEKIQVAILNQSIMNSWQGVFPLKGAIKDGEFEYQKYESKKVSKAEREQYINAAKEGLKKFKGAIKSNPQPSEGSGENKFD